MIEVCFERSELDLETGLEDVCAATVNGRGCFTVFNVSVDIVEHKTHFLTEIPVQADGEVGFFSPPDSLVVQVYKREPGRKFPGSPSFLPEMEVLSWL